MTTVKPASTSGRRIAAYARASTLAPGWNTTPVVRGSRPGSITICVGVSVTFTVAVDSIAVKAGSTAVNGRSHAIAASHAAASTARTIAPASRQPRRGSRERKEQGTRHDRDHQREREEHGIERVTMNDGAPGRDARPHHHADAGEREQPLDDPHSPAPRPPATGRPGASG